MPTPQRRTRPCEACRSRHLKCDGDIESPCTNCKKSKSECVRPTKAFRFKSGARPKRNLDFSTDQTWVQPCNGQLSFVDETPEMAPETTDPSHTNADGKDEVEDGAQVQSHSLSDIIHHDIVASEPSPSTTVNGSILSEPINCSQHYTQPEVPVDYRRVSSPPSSGNDRPLHGIDTLSPLAVAGTAGSPSLAAILCRSSLNTKVFATLKTAVDSSPNTHTFELGIQEACLVRHFVENLANSFDTTDRDSHFTTTLAQRVLHSPVLLYAVCTASARHLTQLWLRKKPLEVITLQGVQFPELNEDSAIHYHNVCLSLLIDFANHAGHASSEDALAAATILRFYEQVDTNLTGLDAETYQNVVRSVMHSQETEALFTLKSMEQPPRDEMGFISASAGLRYSACLLAIRQEIWSVLFYRRAFRLPISTDLDYTAFTPADDYVWVNRIILWCADVLRFCFGPDTAMQMAASANGSAFERWDAMKAFEEGWAALQPPCFKPLYQAPADPTRGIFFPIIWLTNNAQVLGLQHLELGRMLLAVYNPRRQRVGIGSSAMDKSIEHQLRSSILRLCGLAFSKKGFQAGMTTAAIGISIGGEYIYDIGEQNAIVEFLKTLDEEHAWPTKSVVDALAEAWTMRTETESHHLPRGL